jgi:hypothetical protein
MELSVAKQIAESVGSYVMFDEAAKMYAVYVGESRAWIKPDQFESLSEQRFRIFLLGFMQAEADEMMRNGGPTKH